MARISNTAAYANINPVLTDYFVLTDKANNLATKTCTVKSLQTLFGLSVTQISVSVPAASLHFLNTTPFELIASPGTGYALQIQEIACYMDSGATQFDFTSDGAFTKIGALEFNVIPQSILNSATDSVFNIGAKTNVILPTATALTLTAAANTGTTNGNGILYFNISYQTLKLASTF
tara:strand:- start:842 stop:1372 length:531 start_codon:yes stop_codon:yes gene_type:complete